jgi:hypothetical protein
MNATEQELYLLPIWIATAKFDLAYTALAAQSRVGRGFYANLQKYILNWG